MLDNLVFVDSRRHRVHNHLYWIRLVTRLRLAELDISVGFVARVYLTPVGKHRRQVNLSVLIGFVGVSYRRTVTTYVTRTMCKVPTVLMVLP